MFFEKLWRSALDADISWVTGRPLEEWWVPEARRVAGTLATILAGIAGIVVVAALLVGPMLGSGAAEPAGPDRRAPARPATTTIPPMQVPPSLALALECGSVEHAAQMECLSYLAGVSQETLDGLGFFCANGAGDPAACRARLLAMQIRPAAPA